MGVTVDGQEQAAKLEAYLASAASLAQPLRIQVSAVPETPAPEGIDVVLQIYPDSPAGRTTANLLLGGPPHPRLVASTLAWDEIPQRLVRLVKAYQVERCGRDTFATWTRSLSDEALRERLGLPAGPRDGGAATGAGDGAARAQTAAASAD